MPRSGATAVNTSSGGIGDVKDSILSEALFQAQNGSGWVLMDGRNVSGSKYHTLTGNVTIPDHRGIGRRGKNNGRADGNQDPAGEVALGTFQSSQNEAHDHDMFTRASSGVGGAQVISSSATANTFTDTVSIQNRGGLETRIKGLVLNVFIKIN